MCVSSIFLQGKMKFLVKGEGKLEIVSCKVYNCVLPLYFLVCCIRLSMYFLDFQYLLLYVNNKNYNY